MLIRGQTTEQRIAEIASKFGQAAESLGKTWGDEANFKQEQNRYAEAKNLQQEALKRQEAIQSFELSSKIASDTGKFVDPSVIQPMLKSGDFAGISEALKSAPLTRKTEIESENLRLDREGKSIDRNLKQRQLDELNKPYQETKEYQKAVGIAQVKAAGKKEAMPKQNEFAAAGFSKRARQAEADLAELPADIGTGKLDGLKSYIPNAVKPENTKLFEQAKRNFITANLRKESGASISDTEYSNEEQKYYPQPGDTQTVIAQKARAREQAILNLEAEGQNALGRIGDAPRSAPAPTQVMEQIKAMSREEKIKLLQGG